MINYRSAVRSDQAVCSRKHAPCRTCHRPGPRPAPRLRGKANPHQFCQRRTEVASPMSSPTEHPAPVVVTALLTTGAARVAHGVTECAALVEEILALDHVDQETILWVGDVQFHSSRKGPYPNHQMRVSVRPSADCAALSYTDHDDPIVSLVNSFNSGQNLPEVYLIFNGDTGDVFPQSSVIPISHARTALLEWLRTRSLPTSIDWRPFDQR